MPEQTSPTTGESDKERTLQQRHAAYYVGLAAQAERQYEAGGDGVLAGLAVFDQERDQLDAARAWLQAQPPNPNLDALLMADADATVHIGDLRYDMRTERIPQLQNALVAAQRRERRAAQGYLLCNLGVAYAALGEAGKAISLHEQQLFIARESGDRYGEGAALGNVGVAYTDLGKARTAISFYEQHLAIAHEIGDRRSEGAALSGLGNAYTALGDARTAISFYEQQLVLTRKSGDRRRESNALSGLGNAYTALGDARTAISFYEQQLVLTRKNGDRRGEGNALSNLGNAYATLDERQRAAKHYAQALTVTREIEDIQGVAINQWNLGLLLAQQGDLAAALPQLEQSLAFYQAIEHPDVTGMAAAIAHLRTHGRQPILTSKELLALLPESVRTAVEQQDKAARQAALAALPPEEQAQALQVLIQLKARTLLEEQRERFAALLQAVAQVACGDTAPQAQVETELAQLEQRGWHLSAAVQRIWAGERDLAALTAGLNEQDSTLIARALELISMPESPREPSQPVEEPEPTPEVLLALLPDSVRAALEQDQQSLQAALEALSPEEQAHAMQTLQALQHQAEAQLLALDPQALLAELPESVRAALEQQDEAALQTALGALPPEEQAKTIQTLTQLMARTQVEQLRAEAEARPDIDEIVRRLLPLLGDIALAAHGDPAARALAKAHLALLEEHGWHLTDAARRIWAGERDEAALTAGIDPNSARLVRRVLALVADGPSMVFAAVSLTIAHYHRQADAAFAQAQRRSPEERAALARQFAEMAEQFEQQPGAPWADLAAHLRSLAQGLGQL